MKRHPNNWTVQEYADDKYKTPVSTFERTSLTRVLGTFTSLLRGAKCFIIAIPDVKTYVIYRKDKGDTK